MIDLAWAGQGRTKGSMWPSGRSLPRSGLGAATGNVKVADYKAAKCQNAHQHLVKNQITFKMYALFLQVIGPN